MLLSKVEITDFLSIKGTLPIDFDNRVTILLGSNDHGKSNVLRAIEHLNSDTPITEEEANWDATGIPAISFEFSLTLTEIDEWKSIVEIISKRIAEEAAEAARQESVETETDRSDTSAEIPAPAITLQAKPPLVKASPTPSKKEAQSPIALPKSALNPAVSRLKLTLTGVGSDLQFEGIELSDLPAEMTEFLIEKKPRVELFKALSGNLQDSTTATTIATDEYEFLQGVFFYAGLDPKNSAQVFTQDDKTIRALDKASKELDKNLRQLWGQGTELHFELRHKGSEILFLADDPAIKSRKARMSKRSAGVTQFFRVSMVLYARRKKTPANSYIYLFDEPGVLLHPQGQRDLLQVFEQLADESQIIYATHSLFLLNQNYPERHRLIYKDEEGTKVDQKPLPPELEAGDRRFGCVFQFEHTVLE
jgi:predicted ATPase